MFAPKTWLNVCPLRSVGKAGISACGWVISFQIQTYHQIILSHSFTRNVMGTTWILKSTQENSRESTHFRNRLDISIKLYSYKWLRDGANDLWVSISQSVIKTTYSISYFQIIRFCRNLSLFKGVRSFHFLRNKMNKLVSLT